MASGDASTKGKAPIRVDDDDVVQEWLERKIPVLPLFPESRQLQGQGNYGICKVLMESMLETHDLLLMVSQECPRPVVKPGDGSSASSFLLPTTSKEANQWDTLNARIRSFIFMSCTPAVLEHIKNMTGAREIWLRLGALYNRMIPMKRVSLEVQMRTLKPSQSPRCQTISTNCSR